MRLLLPVLLGLCGVLAGLSTALARGVDICSLRYITKMRVDDFDEAVIERARKMLRSKSGATRCWGPAAYVIGVRGTVYDLAVLTAFITQGQPTDMNGGASVGQAALALGKLTGRYRDQPAAKPAIEFLARCTDKAFWSDETTWRATTGESFTYATKTCIKGLGFVDHPSARNALTRLLKSLGDDKWMRMRIENALSRQSKIRAAGGVNAYLLKTGQ
jgi:hypothetical protein